MKNCIGNIFGILVFCFCLFPCEAQNNHSSVVGKWYFTMNGQPGILEFSEKIMSLSSIPSGEFYEEYEYKFEKGRIYIGSFDITPQGQDTIFQDQNTINLNYGNSLLVGHKKNSQIDSLNGVYHLTNDVGIVKFIEFIDKEHLRLQNVLLDVRTYTLADYEIKNGKLAVKLQGQTAMLLEIIIDGILIGDTIGLGTLSGAVFVKIRE